MVIIATKETKYIILHTRNLNRELTTNDFCDDYYGHRITGTKTAGIN